MFIISSQYLCLNYSRKCGGAFGVNGSNFLLFDNVGFRIGTIFVPSVLQEDVYFIVQV